MIPDDTPTPIPEPGSSLVPPARRPPTAVAADAPLNPRERGEAWLQQTSVVRSAGSLVRYLLDAMDVLGDTVADGLGIRRRPADGPGEPPPAA